MTLDWTLLRSSLAGNAVFSTTSGLVFLFAASSVAGLLGLPARADVIQVGVMLLAFAAGLGWLVTRPVIPAAWVRAVIAADIGWVVLSVAAAAAGLVAGWALFAVLMVADVVALFAFLQWLGLRRARLSPELRAG